MCARNLHSLPPKLEHLAAGTDNATDSRARREGVRRAASLVNGFTADRYIQKQKIRNGRLGGDKPPLWPYERAPNWSTSERAIVLGLLRSIVNPIEAAA